ncbi:MAG: hypothetical protein WBA88_18500 [Pseudaminobacter sp.]|jgi:protein-S-isoprenylcysteine O-methyltransferase Ste14|uniref:Protein-S-isoprenylcysteine O-methyltransferase Ste14 n=1 Tax=Aquamicrobium defluvii TaxID=69279 RepID=A0A011TUW1_9HYPH|nr:hypothetical protein [Aquamicrobium defluvii]EXL07927.1 hypothetical protein BG36_04730 [Aquamicrobium defluvii]EZQ15030.1 hypothetical protein CF98_13670 [Halopseudomonas bauzanensis]TDR34905.1 hypothetical protein DES43_112117 [Aquamicrobium defluvii]
MEATLGFMVQWPTLLAMLPVLVALYVRLARREEAEVCARFGEAYDRYAARVPAFLPRWTKALATGGEADGRRIP